MFEKKDREQREDNQALMQIVQNNTSAMTSLKETVTQGNERIYKTLEDNSNVTNNLITLLSDFLKTAK